VTGHDNGNKNLECPVVVETVQENIRPKIYPLKEKNLKNVNHKIKIKKNKSISVP
jgi:hypothetical protein